MSGYSETFLISCLSHVAASHPGTLFSSNAPKSGIDLHPIQPYIQLRPHSEKLVRPSRISL